ncbi:MAG TPA: CrcB family protein [Fimbriimonadaceae bacterium]|nr:CrcB family protein [Fimbriimonadaceae bacterium]HRJ32067.1 CrcB family protein [Fimbriimonadaceae bacterium]
MSSALVVFIGGGLGAVCRWGLSLVMLRIGVRTPWPTLVVNVVGCFAAGLLFGLAQRHGWSEMWLRGVFIGFLGGFTTFSALGLESWALFERGEYVRLAVYVASSVILGLVVCFLGVRCST